MHMDSEIAQTSSGSLVEKFLGDGEIPIYMDLKFNVAVNLVIGFFFFPPMSAPFDKLLSFRIESNRLVKRLVESND